MEKVKREIFKEELSRGIDWLISLRWFVVPGVFLVITVAHFMLRITLPVGLLYAGGILLLLYNIILFMTSRQMKKYAGSEIWLKRIQVFANMQISIDLLLLTYFLFLSGGVENPFIFFYIFHMVIASILLPVKAAFLQGTFAVFLVGLSSFGSIIGLTSFHLPWFAQTIPDTTKYFYFAGSFVAFSATLYITIYLATTIMKKLKVKENELMAAYEKLETQDRIKSEYILTVSHDLKSSLTAIQSCLKVVLIDLTGPISKKTREMLTRAERRSRLLLNFVKELLDLSRLRIMKDNNHEKNEVSLLEVINKHVEGFKTWVEQKNIEINIHCSTDNTVVTASKEDIDHALLNLISNAVKYTPGRGKICIDVEDDTHTGFITVRVKDNGIGIPEDELPHVFDDFYRAKNAQIFESDGTGLGLAIVKQVMNRYGGKIWIESEEGKGTSFIITLPGKECEASLLHLRGPGEVKK